MSTLALYRQRIMVACVFTLLCGLLVLEKLWFAAAPIAIMAIYNWTHVALIETAKLLREDLKNANETSDL